MCSHFNIEDGRKHATFLDIMFYYFKKCKNTTEIQKICAVCIEGAVTDSTCQKWFAKSHAEDFSLDDAPWLGRPVEVDQTETFILENKKIHKVSLEKVQAVLIY